MTSPRPSPRRWFLQLSALLAVAVGLGPKKAIAAPPVAGGVHGLHGELACLLPDRVHAAVVGAEYLASAPHEADLDGLQRRFQFALDSRHGARAAVAERLRRDFAEGDTVRLRGWVLARTEARLCAMAALTERGGPLARTNRLRTAGLPS